MLESMTTTYILILLLLLVVDLFRVYRAGSGVKELVQTKFHEIAPVRGFLWLLFLVIVYCLIFAVVACATIIMNLLFSHNRSPQLVWNLLFALGLTLLFWSLSKETYRRLLEKSFHKFSIVKLGGGVTRRYGVNPQALGNLGLERFPNEKSLQQASERVARVMILLVGAATALLTILIFCMNFHIGLGVDFFTPLQAMAKREQTIETSLLIAASTTMPTLVALVLFVNKDYTLFTFKEVLLLKFLLFNLCAFLLIALGYNTYTVVLVLSFIVSVYGFRMVIDLVNESRYLRNHSVYKSIAEKIETHVPYLNQILLDSKVSLGPLDENELLQRISEGCKKIEQHDLIAARNYGRFLKLIEVQHEEVSFAVLRYLTVRRYIDFSFPSATSRSFQRPKVPIWDVTLFPVEPPDKYIDWIDPLILSSEWDIVESCYSCGGSGVIIRTVSDSDGTRTITETCSACMGTGRLAKNQILKTQWRKMMPLVTHPSIPTPELVEEAAEKIVFHQKFTENFNKVKDPVIAVKSSPSFGKTMHQTSNFLKQLQDIHKSDVEKVHEAYLYRSDFQIGLFRLIMIKFATSGGESLGWFFGKSPEFYFPRLPLSHTTLCTLLLLPPLSLSLLVFLWRLSEVLFPIVTNVNPIP